MGLFSKTISNELLITTTFFAAIATLFMLPVFLGKSIIPGGFLWKSYIFRDIVRDAPSNINTSDLLAIFYPFLVYSQQSLRSFSFALWNPYLLGGIPMLWGGGPLNMALDPTSLPFFIFPSSIAFGYVTWVRLIASCLFCFVFARRLGLSYAGSLISGITYTYNLTAVVDTAFPPILQARVWVPVILLLVVEAHRKNSIRYAALSGVVFGYAVLISGPVAVLYSLGLIVFLFFLLSVARHLLRLDWKCLTSNLIILCVFATVSAVVAAPVLYGTVIQIAESSRIYEIASIQAQSFYPLVYLTTFLNPTTFGGWNSFNDLGLPCCWPNYVTFVHYYGILPLFLSFLPLLADARFVTKNKAIYFFYLVMVFSLLAALGKLSPLYDLLVHVPYFFASVVTYWFEIQSIAVAILAGTGLTLIEKQTHLKHLSGKFFMLAVFLAFVGLSTLAGLFLLESSNLSPPTPNVLDDHYIFYVDLTSLGILAYEICCRGRLVKATSRFFSRRTLATLVVVLVVIVDLGAHSAGWITYTDSSVVYPSTAVTAYLDSVSPPYRVVWVGDMLNPFPPDAGMIYGILDARGYASTIPQRFLELAKLTPGFYYTQNQLSYHSYSSSNLLDLMGVKYVVSGSTISNQSDLTLAYSNGSIYVYENTNVMPRAFMVHRVVSVPNVTETQRLMNTSVDFRKVAVFESDKPLPSYECPTAFLDNVTLVAYSSDSVLIQVETRCPGYLVFTDNYYPGWQAYVDGKSAKIYPADLAFRGVVIQSGSHTVVFAYSPKYFLSLLSLSFATIGVILFVSVAITKRNRKTSKPMSRSSSCLNSQNGVLFSLTKSRGSKHDRAV